MDLLNKEDKQLGFTCIVRILESLMMPANKAKQNTIILLQVNFVTQCFFSILMNLNLRDI